MVRLIDLIQTIIEHALVHPHRYFLSLPFSMPAHLYTLIHDPLRLIDLSVPHAFIQFDDFRIRDAELVTQGFEALSKLWTRETRGVSGLPARG